MNKEEIVKELHAIFAEVFEDPTMTITLATSANDIDAWDSLNHVYLMAYIQKKFKIKFKASEMQEFKNVGEICDAIAAKLAK
jgi:acyl carrier protein